MKARLLFVFVVTCLLAACATTGGPGGATVEDRSTTAGGAAAGAGEEGGGAQTYGAGEEATAGFSELNEPGSVLSQRTIYFDYDSSNIKPEFEKVVEAHAEFLADHPNVTVSLEGHADERGSREYNLALGERRARAVKQQMVLLGAAPDQLRVVSYGEERPAVEGHDEYAWSQNRRVEIVY
jgi:peptidoglycan-associated lipoprotein